MHGVYRALHATHVYMLRVVCLVSHVDCALVLTVFLIKTNKFLFDGVLLDLTHDLYACTQQ